MVCGCFIRGRKKLKVKSQRLEETINEEEDSFYLKGNNLK